MSEDLKIEIRELFALHETTVRLKHAVSEFSSTETIWQDFPPSSFIYAFFTFNSIYSFDWQSSFADKHKAIRWQSDKNLEQKVQLESYLKYVNTRLSPNTPIFYSDELKKMLKLFDIVEPLSTLEHIDFADSIKKNFCKHFSNVLKGDQNPENFYLSACHLLKFIYKVRCNVFHGEKTVIKMFNHQQQQRLLIYSALLIAANSLLFQVVEAEKANIDWKEVSVESSPSKES